MKSRQVQVFCKQILFILTAVVLFFIGLEVILALAGVKPILSTEDPLVGFAENIPLYVESHQDDGVASYKTAGNKLHRFNYQAFPKHKAKNSYRIFCIGGSTTYGSPYLDNVSFCGWLRAFLQAAEPNRNWEVINAGGISYASYRVASLMNELAQYQPDLFIVYTGQNEFLEHRSYGQLADLPSWIIHADSALNSTRVYSGLKGLLDTFQPDSKKKLQERYKLSGEVDAILTHTAGPTSYHRDEKLKQQILTHYRINLERIVKTARNSDADVIFIQPAVNLKDMSPFKSEHKKGLSNGTIVNWNKLLHQADEFYQSDRLSAALDIYRQAQIIDDHYAELHFKMGRTLFGLGRYDEAKKSFWRAIDEDIAPLRMLSSMQSIILEVTSESNVPLLDFQQILRRSYQQKYNHTVFGKELFVDHVHTNAEGYRLLGLGLINQLIELGIAAPTDSWGEHTIAAVTKQVNLTLNRSKYDKALLQMAKVFGWAGKFPEAHNLLINHLELFGPQADIYVQLGHNSRRKGNDTEAIYYFRRALAMGFNVALVHYNLGDLLEKKGNIPEAIREYSAALRRDPDYEPTALKLMELLVKEQKYDDAVNIGWNILGNNPELYKVHNLFGIALMKQGELQQAIEHFSEASRIKPDFLQAMKNLQKAKLMLEQKKVNG